MPEVVAQSNLGTCPYTSGGGFSTYHPTPLYQLENVKNYLALVVNDVALRPAPGYNGAGRGYPDITIQGYYYVTVSGPQFYLSSGTSASSPAMAAIFSNLNAARMRIGKGAVGFVHPALYKYATKFTNDVVGGNNKCTQNSQICCTEGFHATPGWDPASGLGSINYGKMEAVFMALGKEANALTPFPSSTPTTAYPSIYATARPTAAPTLLPSLKPTSIPSLTPTTHPTAAPTPVLSLKPTSVPSTFITQTPVNLAVKSMIPSSVPTLSSSAILGATHSTVSSVSPTAAPTMIPSSVPTSSPSTLKATSLPSRKPTFKPSKKPVIRPSRRPSRRPTAPPSEFPTSVPTSLPTGLPTSMPSSPPPSEQPTTTASEMDDDYWTKWLPTSQLTNAPSDPPFSGLHGNSQIDLPPTNSPTIKTSGSIRAIQVDILSLNIIAILSQFIFTSYSFLSSFSSPLLSSPFLSRVSRVSLRCRQRHTLSAEL